MAQRSLLRDLVAGPAPGLRERVATPVDPTAFDEVAAEQREARHPIERGFAAGLAGMTAGGYASQAVDAELAGDPRASALRDQSLAYQQHAANSAIPEMDYRNVHGLGDAAQFVGGHLGSAAATMAPALAAGLVTRGRGALRVPTSYAGALVPSYTLQRNEILAGHYADPELAELDPQARLDAARAGGAVGGALEAIVPAGLAGGVGRRMASPLRTIATNARDEAITEAAQGATGILADETLRTGSLQQALPELVSEESVPELINSALAGAVGGGGMAAPVAATQGAAELAAQAAERAAAAAPAATELVGKAGEAGGQAVDKLTDMRSNLRAWAEGAKELPAIEDMSTEDVVTELNSWAAQDKILPDDPAEAVLSNSTDPQEIMAAQQQAQANAPQRALVAAQALNEDEQAPLELRDLAGRVLRGEAPPTELVSRMGDIQGYQAGRMARRATGKFIVAVDDAAKAMKSTWDAAGDGQGVPTMVTKSMREGLTKLGVTDEQVRKMSPKAAWERLNGGAKRRNRQEIVEDSDLVRALHSELRPEIREDADTVSKLPLFVRMFRGLDMAEPSREAYTAMRRLLPALDVFQDKNRLFERAPNLKTMVDNLTRAETEAAQDGSFLVSNMVPEFRQAAPEARGRVGRILDRAAFGEEPDAREMALLERAFGSRGATRTLLRDYKQQMPLLKSVGGLTDAPTEEQALDAQEQPPADDADDLDFEDVRQGISEVDGSYRIHYAPGTRDRTPMLAAKTEDALVRGKAGKVTPAAKLARELRERGERAEVVNLATLVRERDMDPAQEADRLRAAMAAREEAGTASPEDLILFEQYEHDDEGLLRAHEVVRSEAPDNAVLGGEDRLIKSYELKSKAGVLVRQAKSERATPAQRAAARSTLFKVHKINGQELELSAESLWKYYGDRHQAEKGERGIVEGESQRDADRALNMFSQAIAEIALDPDVDSIELPPGLVIDRKLKVKVPEDVRVKSTERGRAKAREREAYRRANDSAALQALSEKDFAGRMRAIANNTEMSIDTRLDMLAEVAYPNLEGIKGPRRAYLYRRAEVARGVMDDLIDRLVPPPYDQQEALGSELEAFSEQAERAYQRQSRYVADLVEVLGHRNDQKSAAILDRANIRLEELEERANPARTFDETTGESLLPGSKEAAVNASGVKSAARTAQADADAGESILIPAPRRNPDPDDEPPTPRTRQAPPKPTGKVATARNPTPAEMAARRARDAAEAKAAREKAAKAKAAKAKAGKKNNMMSFEIHERIYGKAEDAFPATHDSPHRFDGNFNWREHKKKGEGAMMFGAGTYLSTAEGVHRSYKNKFTAITSDADPQDIAFFEMQIESETKKRDELLDRAKKVPGPDSAKYVAQLWNYRADAFQPWDRYFGVFASKEEAQAAAEESAAQAAQAAMREARPTDRRVPATPVVQPARPLLEVLDIHAMNIEAAQEQLDSALKELNPSPTYHVTVRATKGEILDWDKPLEEQPEVLAKLRAAKSETEEHRPLEHLKWEESVDFDDNPMWNATDEPDAFGFSDHYRIDLRDGKYVTARANSSEADIEIGTYDNLEDAKAGLFTQTTNPIRVALKGYVVGDRYKHPARLSEATGARLYHGLSDALGSDEAASDYLQELGIVGHRFASSNGTNDKFPNYVIYDDSRIVNNAVSFNRQSELERKKSGIGISRALKDQISEEVSRITGLAAKGKKSKLFFVKAKEIDGASGEYSPAERVIKIAISAADPMGVAYHESLHDFIAGLEEVGGKEGRQLRNQLFKAGEMPHVRAQLKELLKGHPNARAQIDTDPEERIAYLFQFWAQGKLSGKPVIKLNNKDAENALMRLARWIRELVGVVGREEQAEALFEALYDGKFADRNITAAVIKDLKLETLEDKFRRISGPLADYVDKMMLVATDRLRNHGVAELDELADMFMTEPGREQGQLRFLQRRAKVAAQFDNHKAKVLEGATNVELTTALRNLQSMKPPSTGLERRVATLLADMHKYMVDAGVQRFDAEKKQWVPLGKQENYFPRRWDANAIQNNEEEFKQLLFKYGVKPDQQLAIVSALTRGESLDLADNDYHVGYTPFAAAVQDRQLTFINKDNAAEFIKFQQGDLGQILTDYIFQAVHRAEFARDFGNAGDVIEAKFEALDKKLDPREIAEARTTVKALVGTLGADINPRLKGLYSAAVTAENVILLPLTIFSQFIDALGVGLRAQDATEAWNAFKRGMGDFAKAVRRKDDPDYDTEMAKTIGLIDEQNMLEAMGQVHAGAFMSGHAKKINRMFFRINGMDSWNRSMRVSAMVAGERFIQRNLDNDRFMRELGLEASDVMPMEDGRLAVTADQMQALGASPKEAAEREFKIQEALFRFVDGAVLRPNAANRPAWMSDPHWMLIAHLKQFAFAFQKTILARVNNELEHGQVLPAAILAAYVPVTMASGLARASLTGTPIGDGGMLDLMNYGVMRSGILGTGSFGADAFSDLQRGDLPGTSLIGPTAEHLWMSSRFVVGDPQIDAGRIMDRSLPFARYF